MGEVRISSCSITDRPQPVRRMLKYPSMTGQDPMFQTGEVNTVSAENYDSSGAQVGCECLDCKVKRNNYQKSQTEEVKTMTNVLYVYEVVAVDTQEGEIVAQKSTVGTEADKGLLSLGLTEEHQKWLKKGRLIIFNRVIGSFNRYLPEVSLSERISE